MTQDGLEAKREQLEDLEKSEREARRLEEALSSGRPSTIRSSSSQGEEGATEEQGTNENEARRQDESAYLPPHPGPNPVKRRAPGMGLLSALSYTLHGMMDVDPETARRNSISKTRESISQVRQYQSLTSLCLFCAQSSLVQLEDALHLSTQDLKYSSSTIQADLDRFQRQKVADLRQMAISLAESHRDWCKKVRETVIT